MFNINHYKIITTKTDFKRITNTGCLLCREKKFSYYGNVNLYECSKCRTLYATDVEGIISILELKEGIIRVYKRNRILIDDDIKDFEINYKNTNNFVKKRTHTSNR